MSIASEITRIHNNIQSAFNSVSLKGGTVPSSKVIANLPTAINSIGGGLTPQIIVTTDGTAVYATKGSTTVNGTKSGSTFIISLPSTGTWTVTATTTAHSGTGTGTVNVQKISRYSISISVPRPKPTDLTDTYWKWNDNAWSVTGTSTRYRGLNCEVRDCSVPGISGMYMPFKQETFTIDDGTSYSGSYYTVVGADGGWPYNVGYLRYNSSQKWAAYVELGDSVDTLSGVKPQYFCIYGGSQVTDTTAIDFLWANATQCDSSWRPLT